MNLVIDAGAAYDLLAEARYAPKISKASEILAPDLIVSELLNCRWKVMRAGQKAPALARILEFLERLRIMPSLPYAAGAAALAERIDHPVYDCIYVSLAQSERCRFLTMDERLSRKLRSFSLSKLLQ